MKNKIFFSEGRLVFKTPAPVPGQAPGKKEAFVPKAESALVATATAVAEHQQGQAEVQAATAKAAEGMRTQLEVGKLKEQLGEENYATLLSNVGMNNELFEETLHNFEIGKVAERKIKVEVSKRLQARNMAGLAVLANAVEGNLKTVLTEMYSETIINNIRSHLNGLKPAYNEYMEEHPGTVFKYAVILDSDDQASVEITSPPNWASHLVTFKKDNPEKTAEEVKSAQEIKTQAASLAKTPLGKLLKMVGFKDEHFQKVVSGENVAGIFLFGLFGYKQAGIGEAYAGLVDMVPEEQKPYLKSLEKKAGGTKMAANTEKEAEKVRATAFEKIISTGQVEKNFVMDTKYEIPEGKGIDVNLSNGGKMTIPKGVKAYAEGRPLNTDSEDRVYEAKDTQTAPIRLTGSIPAGVKFSGKIGFKKVPFGSAEKKAEQSA